MDVIDSPVEGVGTAPKPGPPRPPIETCDTNVGMVIEGTHEWHEYCKEHGEQYLRVNPRARHRKCSLYEVLVSWREYRCQACRQLLWDRNDKD